MNTQRYLGPALALIAIVVVLRFVGVNVGAFAPYGLLLLVCPLMMFFMMRGMNNGDGGHDDHDHASHTGGRSTDR